MVRQVAFALGTEYEVLSFNDETCEREPVQGRQDRHVVVAQGGTIDEAMIGDSSSEEELRQRGRELQAALPQPTGLAASGHRRKRQPSEGAEVAEGTVDLALEAGSWGMLLAIPGVIIWMVRRLRRKVDRSPGESLPTPRARHSSAGS